MKAITDENIIANFGKKRIQVEKVSVKKSISADGKSTSEEVHLMFGKEKNIPYRIAKCCKPQISNKRIIAVIGQGMTTIHKKDCGNIKKVSLDRILPVHWSNAPETMKLYFEIKLSTPDTPGMLMQITKVFYDFNANICDIKFHKKNEEIENIFSFEVETDNHFFYETFVEKLKFVIPEAKNIELLVQENR